MASFWGGAAGYCSGGDQGEFLRLEREREREGGRDGGREGGGWVWVVNEFVLN